MALSASTLLSGCAIPGMRMDTHDLTPTVNAQGQIVTPKIVPITAQLIQQQEEANAILQALAAKNYHAPAGFTAENIGYHYHIGPQDVIQITVWTPQMMQAPTLSTSGVPSGANSSPDLSGQGIGLNQASQVLTVDSEGNIYYPYIGMIHVGGLTVDEARQVVSNHLAVTIKSPQVSFSVAAFRSQHVEVTGAVRTSAMIPITNVPLTVLDAITQAGGPILCGASTGVGSQASTNLCADVSHITLTRGTETLSLNLNQLRAPNGSSENWILQNNDVIHVPNNNLYRVFILGAVTLPGPYNMVDGTMSLKEAIGDAAGLTTGSDPEYTYVIRNYQHHPKIFSLNMQSPDALSLAGDFQLMPEDVVFISTSPLETFNDLLGQITPSLQTAVYTKSLIQ
jgi:polysaccharide biosynthesis/export protein